MQCKFVNPDLSVPVNQNGSKTLFAKDPNRYLLNYSLVYLSLDIHLLNSVLNRFSERENSMSDRR